MRSLFTAYLVHCVARVVQLRSMVNSLRAIAGSKLGRTINGACFTNSHCTASSGAAGAARREA